MSGFEHPIRQNALIRNVGGDYTAEIMEIVGRWWDVDQHVWRYQISDPTHTTRFQYHQEDLEDVFEDTGRTNEEVKPVMYAWVRGECYDE